MKKGWVLAGMLLVVSGTAQASSSAAWTAHDKQVTSACLKASQLKQAKALGGLIEYPDQLGVSALLIEGRYPQPHMKNQHGQELCLYDKKTAKAFVTEADALGKR